MVKILIVFAIMLLLAAPVTAANVTTIEVRGIVFDSGSSTYNTTLQWDAMKFLGFWYALGQGKSSETLKKIFSICGRYDRIKPVAAFLHG